MLSSRGFVVITFSLANLTGNFHCTEALKKGVITKWSPKGTAAQDALWLSEDNRIRWVDDTIDGVADLQCFEFQGKAEEIHRVVFTSKVEGFVIENFGVTTCLNRDRGLPFLKMSSVQSTSEDGSGYEYKLQFKLKDGSCYERQYVTSVNEFQAKVKRNQEKKLSNCPPGLDNQVQEDNINILEWIQEGLYNLDFSFTFKRPLSSIPMPGPCPGMSVKCWVHKSTSLSGMMADVLSDEHIRLDRVAVTSCTDTYLNESFKCKERIRINVGSWASSEYNYAILFINNESKCIERTYQSTEFRDAKYGRRVEYLVERKDVRGWGDWECEDGMIKGTIHSVGKKFNIFKSKTISS